MTKYTFVFQPLLSLMTLSSGWNGYSVVAHTDHHIMITHDELNDDGFLALHGCEMEITEEKNLI